MHVVPQRHERVLEKCFSVTCSMMEKAPATMGIRRMVSLSQGINYSWSFRRSVALKGSSFHPYHLNRVSVLMTICYAGSGSSWSELPGCLWVGGWWLCQEADAVSLFCWSILDSGEFRITSLIMTKPQGQPLWSVLFINSALSMWVDVCPYLLITLSWHDHHGWASRCWV